MKSDDDYYRVIVPKGTHLAESRDTAGNKRALLFDDKTNALIGPPELFRGSDDDEVNDDDDYVYNSEPAERPLTAEELEELAAGLAVVLVAVIGIAVVIRSEAVPRVRRWWDEKVLPTLRGLRNKQKSEAPPRANFSDVHATTDDLADLSRKSPAEFSQVMDEAFNQYRASMSAAEAHQRRQAVLAAEAFIAEQKRALANVRVENHDYFQHITSTVEQLAIKQLPGTVTLALQASTSHQSGTTEETAEKERLVEVRRVLVRHGHEKTRPTKME